MSIEQIQKIRNEIDELDSQILYFIFIRRLKSRQIKDLKMSLDLPHTSIDRETEIKNNLAGRVLLDRSDVDKIWSKIIEVCKNS